MAAKKRGLGKGLDALLSSTPADVLTDFDDSNELRILPVDQLNRSQYQPRTKFNKEALQELADSIKAQGVVQPIVARPLASGKKFEIIAGERRWRAAQLAGMHEIPVVVRKIDDQNAMCMALIENIQREDLNPLDQAQALKRLIEEFEMTHETIADAVGRSRSSVTNLIRLLDLGGDVKELLLEGKIEMGHARALLSLNGSAQADAARQVVKQGMSVRATENLVNKLLAGKKKPAGKPATTDPNIKKLEDGLSEKLGASVGIKHLRSGKGEVRIKYNSLDELDGILAKIK